MLAADVRADGGGEVTAARRPIVGPARVARFFVKLRALRSSLSQITFVELNGVPTALIQFDTAMARRPRRLAVDVDSDGRIARFWMIANSKKLGAI
jgi:RNA polymerase sigma-70 factor (ECF subfamily)